MSAESIDSLQLIREQYVAETERSNNQHPNVSRFTSAIHRVLRPLIRLMVGNMTYPAFISMAKNIYIEEAERKLKQDSSSKRITKSSLALLTGIDTRQISQAMNAPKAEALEAPDLLPEAYVLGQWSSEGTYKDVDTQKTLDLPVYGRGLTFQNLVTRTVGRNVTAQTVLDRLVSTGNIEYVNENTVRLLSPYYFPLTGAKYELLDVGMQATANLLLTVDNNISHRDDTGQRFVQQQRWSRAIPTEKHEAFKLHMSEFIKQQLNESVTELEQFEDPIPTKETITAGVGYYYFESLPETAEELNGDP